MSPPRWRTEPMTADDLPAVLAIERACFTSPWPEEGFVPDPAAFWARAIVLREGERPSSVRGYICFWVLEGEMEIQNIAVRADCRRLGGASRLMEEAMRIGADAGCRQAWLEVRPSNVAAIAMYDRWGFRVVGRRRRYYRDGEDALLMRAAVRARSAPRAGPRRGVSLKGPRTGC